MTRMKTKSHLRSGDNSTSRTTSWHDYNNDNNDGWSVDDDDNINQNKNNKNNNRTNNTKDGYNDGSNIDFAVESHTVPDQRSFFWKLLDSMNPRTCLQPTIITTTTGATATSTSTTIESSIAACHLPGLSEPIPIDDIVPNLLEKIANVRSTNPKHRSSALQQLYRLTDQYGKHNRVPIVCTTKYNVIGTITKYCLSSSEEDDDNSNNNNNSTVIPSDRRQALLLINNLCIPNENKLFILYQSESYELFMSSLVRIIHSKVPEAFICLVILLNLSSIYQDDPKNQNNNHSPNQRTSSNYDDDDDVNDNNRNVNNNNITGQQVKQKIFSYVPTIRPDVIVDDLNNNTRSIKDAPVTYQFHIPTNDTNSLLRIIEQCVQDYIPYLHYNNNNSNIGSIPSVEQEFIRWSMNLFRSLLTNNDTCHIATIVANQTILAQVAGYCLHTSITKLVSVATTEAGQQAKHGSTNVGKQKSSSSSSSSSSRKVKINVSTWTKDSVEDASLMILVNCAQYNECVGSIRQIKNLDYTLQQLHGISGIHETRAKLLYQRLFIDSIIIQQPSQITLSTSTTTCSVNDDTHYQNTSLASF